MSDETSPRFRCSECGGDVVLVEHVATDASAVESYDCVDCDATGEYQAARGPEYPRTYGSIEER